MSAVTFDYTGERVLVTGAAGLIGRALVHRFADAGAGVLAVDVDADGLKVSRRRPGVATMANDLAREDVADAVFAGLVQDGGLDVLVNNAAMTEVRTPLIDISAGLWDAVIAANLRSAYLLSVRAARLWRDAGRGGAIVNLSSPGGSRAHEDQSAYDVTKAGIEALSRAIAVELGGLGIRANCIAPPASGRSGPPPTSRRAGPPRRRRSRTRRCTWRPRRRRSSTGTSCTWTAACTPACAPTRPRSSSATLVRGRRRARSRRRRLLGYRRRRASGFRGQPGPVRRPLCAFITAWRSGRPPPPSASESAGQAQASLLTPRVADVERGPRDEPVPPPQDGPELPFARQPPVPLAVVARLPERLEHRDDHAAREPGAGRPPDHGVDRAEVAGPAVRPAGVGVEADEVEMGLGRRAAASASRSATRTPAGPARTGGRCRRAAGSCLRCRGIRPGSARRTGTTRRRARFPRTASRCRRTRRCSPAGSRRRWCCRPTAGPAARGQGRDRVLVRVDVEQVVAERRRLGAVTGRHVQREMERAGREGGRRSGGGVAGRRGHQISGDGSAERGGHRHGGEMRPHLHRHSRRRRCAQRRTNRA